MTKIISIIMLAAHLSLLISAGSFVSLTISDKAFLFLKTELKSFCENSSPSPSFFPY